MVYKTTDASLAHPLYEAIWVVVPSGAATLESADSFGVAAQPSREAQAAAACGTGIDSPPLMNPPPTCPPLYRTSGSAVPLIMSTETGEPSHRGVNPSGSEPATGATAANVPPRSHASRNEKNAPLEIPV